MGRTWAALGVVFLLGGGVGFGTIVKSSVKTPSSLQTESSVSPIGVVLGSRGPASGAGVYSTTAANAIAPLSGSLSKSMEASMKVTYGDSAGGENKVWLTSFATGWSYSKAQAGPGSSSMTASNSIEYEVVRDVDGVLTVDWVGSKDTEVTASDGTSDSQSKTFAKTYQKVVTFQTTASLTAKVGSTSVIQATSSPAGKAVGFINGWAGGTILNDGEPSGGGSSGTNNSTPPSSTVPAPTLPGTVVYGEGFENAGAASGWTLSSGNGVQWAFDATPSTAPGGAAYTGTASLNYNDGEDYDNGQTNSGTAKSPPLSLAGLSGPVLTFACNYETDAFVMFDLRRLRLYQAGNGVPVLDVALLPAGASEQVGSCGVKGKWHVHTVTLDPNWSSIQAEFSFNTVTANDNQHAGWFVDDLSVRANTVAGSVESGSVESGSGDDGGGCSQGRSGRTAPGALLPLLVGMFFLLVRRARSALR